MSWVGTYLSICGLGLTRHGVGVCGLHLQEDGRTKDFPPLLGVTEMMIDNLLLLLILGVVVAVVVCCFSMTSARRMIITVLNQHHTSCPLPCRTLLYGSLICSETVRGGGGWNDKRL